MMQRAGARGSESAKEETGPRWVRDNTQAFSAVLREFGRTTEFDNR